MRPILIKQYITLLGFCYNAILFAKLFDEALYVEVFNKVACGLCLLALIYATILNLELLKGNFQKTITLLK